MDRQEFNDWLPYHIARFTGISEWMAKKVDQSGHPMAQSILIAWASVLRNVTLDDAKRASDAMFSKPESEQPRSYDRHPAAVLDLAKAICRNRGGFQRQHHYIGGEQVYDCHHCRDTGCVTCWHPSTVKAVREGHLQEMLDNPRCHPSYTCAVRCHCQSAHGSGWMGDQHDPRKLPKLDDLPTIDDLADWIKIHGPQPHQEFSQYDGRHG